MGFWGKDILSIQKRRHNKIQMHVVYSMYAWMIMCACEHAFVYAYEWMLMLLNSFKSCFWIHVHVRFGCLCPRIAIFRKSQFAPELIREMSFCPRINQGNVILHQNWHFSISTFQSSTFLEFVFCLWMGEWPQTALWAMKLEPDLWPNSLHFDSIRG